jgi:DNA polymerase-4
MASVVARRLCPELIILPGRFSRYEEVSAQFHDILSDLTPVYEPLSLDEAFADLSSLRRLQVNPIEAAHELRVRIREEIGVGSGVGVGRNKLFAKLGSKSAKATFHDGVIHEGPGVFVVTPSVEAQWLDTLSVRALWGVGPALEARLARLGLRSIRDLRGIDESVLARHVGPAMARTLVDYAVGHDPRPVEADRATKSLGHEETFGVSVTTDVDLFRHARRQSAIVARTLRESGQVARRVSVHVKFDDLTSLSRSHTVPYGIDDEEAVDAVASELLHTIERHQPVRLLGVYLSVFSPREETSTQLTFDLTSSAGEITSEERQLRSESLKEALDDVRRRFGRSAVGTGIDFDRGALDVATQRDRHAFGPEATENQ